MGRTGLSRRDLAFEFICYVEAIYAYRVTRVSVKFGSRDNRSTVSSNLTSKPWPHLGQTIC